MNSGNLLHFVGRLTKTPSLSDKNGTQYCRFTLMRNEAFTKELEISSEGKSTAIPFIAFNSLASLITNNCRKGDQLIVTATVKNYNQVIDDKITYGFNFIISSVEYGAPGELTREQF